DLSGRMISSKSYNSIAHNNIETMDISSLASGMYLVEVTTDGGKLIQKVCKQ
ncbi:MAG TPA: T9SS type A sorting domain-containing protein, partial [Bacteroidia bacterium]|nr:T9SS type A sorting domain-containing protein [Bacteroidia bacterium]